MVAYYCFPGFQIYAQKLQELKVRGGLPLAAIGTAFAGAVLPEIAKRLTTREQTPTSKLIFQALFFAVMGMTVDLLYRLMAVLFGPEPTPLVIAKKLLVDQLVYSPFFSMPVSIIVFVWQAAGYSPRETLRTLSKRGFIRRYPPLLIMCWCFWVPVLVAVYALPVNLQFLLFLCTEAAWSLLLVHASHSGSLPEASPVD